MGKSTTPWVLLAIITSWFMNYTIVRTFSNSLETVITIIGIYYWPLNSTSNHHSRMKSIILGAIAFLIRPTAAITWIFLGIHHLNQMRSISNILRFIIQVASVGLLTLAISLCVDYLFYGRWVLVPLNFFVFNLKNDAGAFYGTHPWHWNLTQGFPAILASYLPLFVVGAVTCQRKSLLILIAWVTFVLSLPTHKEFRFLLPVLPIALMYVGYGFKLSWEYFSTFKLKNRNLAGKFLLSVLVVVNVGMTLYFSLVHQAAPIQVMSRIRELDSQAAVHFLTPCHSTPYYSFVHRPIELLFLDCSPSEEEGLDQAERFKLDPYQFVREFYHMESPGNFTPHRTDHVTSRLPTHIVTFEKYISSLTPFFQEEGFVEDSRFVQEIEFKDGTLSPYYMLMYKQRTQ
eukprot:TRINITY_DN9248_c0_g1_i2.p1 TRINITY_DN9248_c0_g1~~TRINITY_DN9248_c0_g1_i2.p1  ORF type:complete len:401 (-),score=109.29 TRINITY_DN9248_c0_g1_i2:8-1210(-)